MSAIDVSELNMRSSKNNNIKLKTLIDYPDESFPKLDANLQSSLADYNIKYSPEAREVAWRNCIKAIDEGGRLLNYHQRKDSSDKEKED